jgi:hypothetical protein
VIFSNELRKFVANQMQQSMWFINSHEPATLLKKFYFFFQQPIFIWQMDINIITKPRIFFIETSWSIKNLKYRRCPCLMSSLCFYEVLRRQFFQKRTCYSWNWCFTHIFLIISLFKYRLVRVYQFNIIKIDEFISFHIDKL